MKKILYIALLSILTFQSKMMSQNEYQSKNKGKIGISGIPIAGGAFLYLQPMTGAGYTYFNRMNSIGINYYYPLKRKLELETGINYNRYFCKTEPAPNPPFSNEIIQSEL